jgi:hypothetical protein
MARPSHATPQWRGGSITGRRRPLSRAHLREHALLIAVSGDGCRVLLILASPMTFGFSEIVGRPGEGLKATLQRHSFACRIESIGRREMRITADFFRRFGRRWGSRMTARKRQIACAISDIFSTSQLPNGLAPKLEVAPAADL